MRRLLVAAFALLLCAGVGLSQQRPAERGSMPQRGAEPQRGGEQRGVEQQRPADPHPPRANQGRIPEPPAKREPAAKPEPDRRGGKWVNNTPHVADNHWYGHDKPNDRRYHVDHPFEHGRFERFGPSYRYSFVRIDPDRRWVWLPSGEYFEVPAWDWPLVSNWCWNCGDDFVVYEDPDHPGWYLLYNIHTGQYVHAQFMGM